MPARSALVGFQVYRVLGFVFLVLWAAGQAPSVWALPVGIGDVLTAIPSRSGSNLRPAPRAALAGGRIRFKRDRARRFCHRLAREPSRHSG
jgi:hypothetical protein